MRVTLIAVGRLRRCFREAADDYLRRLRRTLPVEEREVREMGRAANPALARREEARRLQAAVPPGAVIVALTRGGTPWSSDELAERLDRWRGGRGEGPARDVVFLLGGASGLAEPVTAGARHRWSLGPLTLPHELARVVVLEQLYRAATRFEGHPYHRGRVGPRKDA